MASSDLVLCQVSTGDENDWIVVYEREFPESERATLQRLRDDFAAGKRALHRTLSQSGELLVFSVIHHFGDFLWLSYLARDRKNSASKGVGTQHLEELLRLLKEAHPNARGLFFDVESPKAEGLDADTVKARQSRLKVYLDAGATEMPADKRYVMPNFVAGQSPIPARLVWFKFGTGELDLNADLRLVIGTVYKTIYALAPEDSLIEEIVSQFSTDQGGEQNSERSGAESVDAEDSAQPVATAEPVLAESVATEPVATAQPVAAEQPTPTKRFVQVYPESPAAGANSGGVGGNEQDEEFWKKNLDPRYDRDILSFIATAEIGQYIVSERGLFVFRTK